MLEGRKEAKERNEREGKVHVPGKKEGRKEGSKEGRKEGRKGGRTGGRKEGRKEGRVALSAPNPR
jgi:hypothetical protein